MDNYIYSEADIASAIEEAVKETFNWKYNLVEVFSDMVVKNLKENANLYRFYGRNCCGCVDDNEGCDFVRGKGKGEGAYEKARKGEIFDCPVRGSGTLHFDPKEGLQRIDISDRGKKPYPIIKIN